MTIKEKFKDEDVRQALAYLMDTLTKLHNEYAAGGAWCGAPIPLYEIAKRLDLTEAILLNGTTEAIELVRDPKGDFQRYDKALQDYLKERYKQIEDLG
jgi:hypothetical protein